MRYKGAPLHLHNMMKLQVELDKSCIQSLISKYEELSSLVNSVEGSYTQLFRNFDVMARKYGTPSIGTLTQAKEKNQIRLELDMYFDQLMLMAISEDL